MSLLQLLAQAAVLVLGLGAAQLELIKLVMLRKKSFAVPSLGEKTERRDN